MKIAQYNFQDTTWKSSTSDTPLQADLVLCFGERDLLQPSILEPITKQFPDAYVVTASTAGEINNAGIQEKSVVCTAIEFEQATVQSNKVNVKSYSNSKEAGKALIAGLAKDDLKLLFVLSDGQLVNGSDLLEGINEELDTKIPVVGGLAGDGTNFGQTYVGLNKDVESGNIVGIGLYGNSLNIGYASAGGWEAFGPTRTVTKSEKNVLYELDGKSALELYIRYLGDHAAGLPGTGLLFPLALQQENGQNDLVRTLLSVDEQTQSMTFAGNVPNGTKVRLMRSNLDRLAEAAAEAAEAAQQFFPEQTPQLSIIISCVGRKLLFDQRIEEEVEEIRDVLGDTILTGFYSYGEISPAFPQLNCQLYNQTMAITTISEVLER